jgi:hypothetical protein
VQHVGGVVDREVGQDLIVIGVDLGEGEVAPDAAPGVRQLNGWEAMRRKGDALSRLARHRRNGPDLAAL